MYVLEGTIKSTTTTTIRNSTTSTRSTTTIMTHVAIPTTLVKSHGVDYYYD